MKTKGNTQQMRVRRENAKSRLEEQLKAGTKPERATGNMIPLTDFDRKRINAEIEAINKKKK